uniref:Uncharacterized protein n=1 Tax=Populus trichocarpa TaxID=3694 RepID=A0A3N7E9R2_POPTR|eukprot:XP_002299675.3 uncharacterized protein LOC7486689 [Populus trichocarpa]
MIVFQFKSWRLMFQKLLLHLTYCKRPNARLSQSQGRDQRLFHPRKEAELPSFPKLELEDLHMVLCLTNQLLSTNLRIMTHLGQIVVQKMMGKTHQGKIERFRR